MKLLLLFLSFCSVSISAKTKKSVVITPKATFIGIKKSGSTYSIQKLSDGMLLGTKEGVIGRGYLEFDLVGKIPSGAEIDFAEIKLGSKESESTNNFGGKIRLEQAGSGINTVGSSQWDIIKTIGQTNDNLGLEVEYTNPTTIHHLTGEVITNAVKGSIGRQVAFKINHKNENGSKYIFLDIPDGGFSLTIHYYVEDSTPPPSSEGTLVSRYSLVGADYLCDFYPTSSIAKTKNPWVYNNTYFDVHTNQDSYLLLKVKSNVKKLSGFIKTTISYKSTNKTYFKDIFIMGDISPKVVGDNSVIGKGENITFYIPGLENLIGGVIKWTALDNVTLISGQGTNKPIFRADKNGFGLVRIDIAWDDYKPGFMAYSGIGRVWVGRPASIEVRADQSKLNFSSKHTLYADSPGATSFSWRLMGNARFENGTTTITTTSNQINIKTLADPDPGMGQILRITCEATNKCGSVSGSTNIMFTMGKGIRSSLSIENALSPLSEMGYIKSIKVYNLTGSLVYSEENVSKDFNIHKTTLSDGIYIIEKSDGENKTTEKVILKR